jgi:hypothetical protein
VNPLEPLVKLVEGAVAAIIGLLNIVASAAKSIWGIAGILGSVFLSLAILNFATGAVANPEAEEENAENAGAVMEQAIAEKYWWVDLPGLIGTLFLATLIFVGILWWKRR